MPRRKKAPLVEVQPVREVPRDPEHCGQRMQKLQNPNPANGGLLTTIYHCKPCGHQERMPEPKRESAPAASA